jgi:ATP-binding cassette, subfamily B, bacterial
VQPRPADASLRIGLAVLALVALAAFGAVVDYWASRLLSSAGLHIAADLRIQVLAQLQRLSLRYHSSQRVGDLTARVTSDVAATQDMVVQVLATLLPSLALVIGMFTVMLTIDPVFTGLALLVTPVLALLTHRSRQDLRLAARLVRRTDGAMASAAAEDLAAIHLVQAFTLEPERLARFAQLTDDSLIAGLRSVRLQSRFGPLVEVAGSVSAAVVLWFGAQRVVSDRLSLGVLLVFLSYLGSLYKPIKALSKLANVVSKGAAAAERIGEVLDARPAIQDRPGVTARRISGAIEFRQVGFTYGREPVLEDISFRVERPWRWWGRPERVRARLPPWCPACSTSIAARCSSTVSTFVSTAWPRYVNRCRWCSRTPCCSKAPYATTSSAASGSASARLTRR